MTNMELNKAIKAELKKAGYNTKDFRVSVKDSLYDTTIRIKIKSPYVNLHDVERLLKHRESYELDVASGEILQGGNTYVFIEYDYNAFDLIPHEYEERAEKILNDAENNLDGFEIANNGVKSLHLLNMTNYGGYNGELRVIEFDKNHQYGQKCNGINDMKRILFNFDTFATIA